MGLSLEKIPVLGSLFGDDEGKFNRAMDRMKQAYMKYRPEIEQAQMRGLQQNLAAFAPVNAALENAYGSGATFDTDALGQNPLHPPPQAGPSMYGPPPGQGAPPTGNPPGGFVGQGNIAGPPAPTDADAYARRVREQARAKQVAAGQGRVNQNPFDNAGGR